jgi:sugar phosphate isomerase/epimerase
MPMHPLSRRDMLKVTAGVMVAAMGTPAHANPLGLPIGSQTWPHRQTIKDGDFAGLLGTLKAIGVEAIELCSPFGYEDFASLSDPKAVRTTLADHGMTCVSAHFGLRELRQAQQKSIDWARAAGITQMIVATLGGGSAPTMDDVKRAAEEYNGIAAVAAKSGVQQGLHNEGFEVSMVDGRRTYDVLLELLDPGLVKFQFQMSTIAQGLVAADYFTKHPGRFFSIHIQDVDLAAPRGAGGRAVQTSVGKGSIDWDTTFKAARTGGVKNYFVEQSMELTKASVAALKTMNA